MSTSDGRFHLVFNGEIYNYRELRRDLPDSYRFRSNGDTEVLLSVLATRGVAGLADLVGMWALALLDVHERTLLLARDPFGIKPLYLARTDGGTAFASEPAVLLDLPGVGRRADQAVCLDYLLHRHVDHSDRTFFAGVCRVPAAHYVKLDLDQPHRWSEPRRYWSPPGRLSAGDVGLAEATDAVRDTFLRSVELHLRSDVRLASALSGGVDSSSVIAAVRYLSGPEQDLHAVTFRAPGETVDETRYARAVAGELNVTLHEVTIEPDRLSHHLPQLVKIQGEPFATTSIYAQFEVFRAAREAGITVMLDGQGADELFGGYTRYVGPRLVELLRGRHVLDAARLVRGSASGRGRMLAPAAVRAMSTRLASQIDRVRHPSPTWLRADTPRQTLLDTRLASSLDEAMRTDLLRASLPALLRYEDRNSMAWSVESRVPFLTTELVDLALSLPEEFVLGPQGETKRVFRAAMRGITPAVALDRKDKVGFQTPEARWLLDRHAWVAGMLGGDVARSIPLWETGEMEATWRRITAGRQPYDPAVWRWLNLIAWTEEFDVAFHDA